MANLTTSGGVDSPPEAPMFSFAERVHWARLYQSQLQKGQPYKELCRTITINVLDYRFLTEVENYHSVYSLYERDTHHRLNTDLEIHFIELPKWREQPRKIRNRLDKWAMYLSNINPAEMEEIAMSEPAIKKALTAEEIFLQQDKERYLYEMREKAIRDEISQLTGAREEGHQAGLLKGRYEGRLEGRYEGQLEGRYEERREVAVKLLGRGFSAQEIADITGLSENDIDKLRH